MVEVVSEALNGGAGQVNTVKRPVKNNHGAE